MAEEHKQNHDAETHCAEYLNGWKRAQADLANYRKDEEKRFSEFAKFAHEAIVRDLIGVLDSIDLALARGAQAEVSAKGLAMIRAQFGETLKKYGVAAIAAETGDAFDPKRHEAIATVPGDEKHPPDTIAEVAGAGYTLNDKVIRPVRVIVAS
jgi:molecular chaperone GrpE